jgi:hypothetical protein
MKNSGKKSDVIRKLWPIIMYFVCPLIYLALILLL